MDLNMRQTLSGIEFPGKFDYIPETKTVNYVGTFNQYLQFMKKPPAVYSLGGWLKDNQMSFEHSLNRRDVDFTGGTYDDLVNDKMDMRHYDEAKKKISKDKIWKEIATKFQKATVRKRIRSEYDGEFDHDKRWDINPFHQRSKASQTARIVKIYVEGSFSCFVESETINAFGGFVSSMINLIESHGTQCEVVACYSGENFDKTGQEKFHMELTVKRAGEYLPLVQLLKVFSSVWYRRAIFTLIASCAQAIGKNVDDCLGTPKSFGKCWEIKDKNLYIYSVPSIEDQKNIVQNLSEVIGV